MLPSISFAKPETPKKGCVVVLVDESLALGTVAFAIDAAVGGLLPRAFAAAKFKGKEAASLDLLAAGDFDRVIVVGIGKSADDADWLKIGGAAMAEIVKAKAAAADIVLDLADAEVTAEHAAGFAEGLKLRAYAFDRYKTKKNGDNGDDASVNAKLTIRHPKPQKARSAFRRREAVADGALLARDLVNEPGNVLGPVEFADRAKALEKLGVDVDILGEKELKKLGMRALLGVAQGSVRPPRVAVMRWNGGKAKSAPVCFVGKGVCFDSGGVSIKPGAGMEDMKGDMGGAAAVTGLMQALAARKAKVNAVGLIGLVENMPDGNAQRPGDIVTSMSGQTIEIINTDAEGRLVLCDVLWYAQDKFKPAAVIDLATLTGAIIIALGHHHAGLFSNNDDLSAKLAAAGEASGEKVWRLPIGKDYDKLIDSKFADMKNTGGRAAGSITAAQFLARFIRDDTPWAHLDVAGTAFESPKNEINQSWASGYGVRLLDRLVADNFET